MKAWGHLIADKLIALDWLRGAIGTLRLNSFLYALGGLNDFYKSHKDSWWFDIAKWIAGFVLTYLLGLVALLLVARRKGSIISRSTLLSLASKPLQLSPKIARWFLFLGFTTRTSKLGTIQAAGKDYFELPALNPQNQPIDPYRSHRSLPQAIIETLGAQQPVLITGTAGAGKSTLLARIVWLALNRELPAAFDDYLPILVPADAYQDSLTRTVAELLQARDGVLVDDESIKSQLQVGRLLILFDDSDVSSEEKRQRLQSIIRTAQHADYRNSRFVIASRPPGGLDLGVPTFRLRPLNTDDVTGLLTQRQFAKTRERVRKQLECFEDQPIQPQLFSMIAHAEGQAILPRVQIYERYFASLLPTNTDDDGKRGWHDAAEMLAQCTLLNTARRGHGLAREQLVICMEQKRTYGDTTESVVERLRRLSGLSVENSRQLLNKFEGMGILNREPRWKFTSDKLEDYLAASYIVSYLSQWETWPALNEWSKTAERQKDFLVILGLVRELMPNSTPDLQAALPSLWKRYLRGEELYPSLVRYKGKEYVRIPAGSFLMGTTETDADRLCASFSDPGVSRKDLAHEFPQHKVDLSDFYISRYPVTNVEYKMFIDATGRKPRRVDDEFSRPYNWNFAERTYPAKQGDFPVVMVTWDDARAYCESMGGRLPTEAEWEKAARGEDGRQWPWGEWQPGRCNSGQSKAELMPIGQFSPVGDSPYGVSEMAGNIWNWCSSLWRDYPYNRDDGREELSSKEKRVLRGGAMEPAILKSRCAFRQGNDPDDYGFSIGFRMVLGDAALGNAEVVKNEK